MDFDIEKVQQLLLKYIKHLQCENNCSLESNVFSLLHVRFDSFFLIFHIPKALHNEYNMCFDSLNVKINKYFKGYFLCF